MWPRRMKPTHTVEKAQKKQHSKVERRRSKKQLNTLSCMYTLCVERLSQSKNGFMRPTSNGGRAVGAPSSHGFHP